MPISHTNRFIFFHVPRCAGTSVEQAFGLTTHAHCHGVVSRSNEVVTLHHLTPADLKAYCSDIEDVYDAYFKFTIIRDPFTRLLSDFYWQQAHDPNGEFRLMTFRDFLDLAEDVVREQRYFEKKHYDHFRPMIEYCFSHGQLMVDDILLLEQLDTEWARISSMTGNVSLPHINASRAEDSRLDTPSYRARVYEIYDHDKQLVDTIRNLDRKQAARDHVVVND